MVEGCGRAGMLAMLMSSYSSLPPAGSWSHAQKWRLRGRDGLGKRRRRKGMCKSWLRVCEEMEGEERGGGGGDGGVGAGEGAECKGSSTAGAWAAVMSSYKSSPPSGS